MVVVVVVAVVVALAVVFSIFYHPDGHLANYFFDFHLFVLGGGGGGGGGGGSSGGGGGGVGGGGGGRDITWMNFYLQIVQFLFLLEMRNGRTDLQMDGLMDGRMDRPSYRDARMNLTTIMKITTDNNYNDNNDNNYNNNKNI